MSKMRVCKQCGKEKPATTEYFHKDKKWLMTRCKVCRNNDYFDNKEFISKRSKERYRRLNPKEEIPNGYKRCNTCNQLKLSTTEFFSRSSKMKDRLNGRCKECRKEKEYSNKINEIKRKRKEYYGENKAVVLERNRVYQLKWNQSDHGRKLNRGYVEKRRTLKANLLSTLTNEQWDECKIFFRSECAYCGKKVKKLQQEHIIPLTKGGHYNRQNIIPSCKKCNTSKWKHDMEEWYKKQNFYSESRLKRIHKWMGLDEQGNTQQIAFF